MKEKNELTPKQNLTEQKISSETTESIGTVNLQSLTLAGHKTSNGEDTIICITCDADIPLEQRLNLLAYVFAKAVQGEVLKRVLKWDLANGCIKFMVAGDEYFDHPRGKVTVERMAP